MSTEEDYIGDSLEDQLGALDMRLKKLANQFTDLDDVQRSLHVEQTKLSRDVATLRLTDRPTDPQGPRGEPGIDGINGLPGPKGPTGLRGLPAPPPSHFLSVERLNTKLGAFVVLVFGGVLGVVAYHFFLGTYR